MKALILAGGLGTRLRPLTLTRPKHLLPIANRPHIEHVFDLLLRNGVDEVVLLTSYLAGAFETAARGARAAGLEVSVAHEPEPLGTAGALKNGEPFLDGDTFLAFNGDILSDVDLEPLLALHREQAAAATLLLTPVEDPSRYGVVPTDADGRVQGFIEKPPAGEAPTNLISAGVYVLEPSVLDAIPPDTVWSAERQLFPELAAAGRMYAAAAGGYWMDIGTPAAYLQANVDALEGRYALVGDAAIGPGLVLAAPGARIADTARVSSSCLARGALVEDGARVERSVLLADSVVERGAVVEDSVLGEGARVAPGAALAGRAVADRTSVERA